LPGRRCTAGR
jgi:hypothetical protein